MRNMKEKIILLSIGTFASLLVFLLSAFLNTYVTKAEYNEIENAIIKQSVDIRYIKTAVDDNKKTLEKIRTNLTKRVVYEPSKDNRHKQ